MDNSFNFIILLASKFSDPGRGEGDESKRTEKRRYEYT